MCTQPVRVLIVDDHPRSRSGLRALLNTMAGVEVIGQAANGREAVRFVEENQPDVILMDAQMPEMDGVQAARQIKLDWPSIRILILTMSREGQIDTVATEVDGVLVKGCPIDRLSRAIFQPD